MYSQLSSEASQLSSEASQLSSEASQLSSEALKLSSEARYLILSLSLLLGPFNLKSFRGLALLFVGTTWL